MSVRKIASVAGAKWGVAAAAIRSSSSPLNAEALDLALLQLVPGSTISAVFTRNAFCAAPVKIAKQRLATLRNNGDLDYIYCLINAGNANAGTGLEGEVAAEKSCQTVAQALGVDAGKVLPFSTGVIGEPLAVEKFSQVADKLAGSLSSQAWSDAALAIMTTDTQPKLSSQSIDIAGKKITISGIAKGAGMIKPNMATMLAYIVSDASITQRDLDVLLNSAVADSFNRITVDGDTSTNDACVLAATGKAGVAVAPDREGWQHYQQALHHVFVDLAKSIIRDAEGATKFITLCIEQGKNSEECLAVAYAVAESPLVKTACFASDPNWGRILAAIGRAGIEKLAIDKVEILLGDYLICASGGRVPDYDEARASMIMQQQDIDIVIRLDRGACSERVWTSDLSNDYIRINAEYRT